MKKFIYLVAIFAFVTLNSIAANSLYFEDDVVVSISQNDLIIISDVLRLRSTLNLKDLVIELLNKLNLLTRLILKEYN